LEGVLDGWHPASSTLLLSTSCGVTMTLVLPSQNKERGVGKDCGGALTPTTLVSKQKKD